MTVNHLFGSNHFGGWRKYTPNEMVNNSNLPVHSTRRCVEVQMVVMALHMIIEELLTGSACVKYSDEGSA